MSKKFFILNAHRDDFIWEPLYFKIIKRRGLKKYAYIGDEFESNLAIELVFTDDCSGIIPKKILRFIPKALRRLFIKAEINNWKKSNGFIRDFKVLWLEDVSIKEAGNDLFFFQLSMIDIVKYRMEQLNNFANVFVHLSHYYLNPQQTSQTLSNIKHVKLCGDSDISQHPFFTKYFTWYNAPFYLVPFSIGERFKITKPLAERTNKIISTGTFHQIENYPSSKYVQEDFGVTAFHHNRRNIFENKQRLADRLVCYNSPWQEASKSWLIKWFNSRKSAQKKYFAFDIVAEYNNYTHAIIGEEIGGFLGIGTLEAMACGCYVILNPEATKKVVEDAELFISSKSHALMDTFESILLQNPQTEERMKRASEFVRNNFSKTETLNKFKITFGL
jgi:glycosyltransferase involved in cell wall biosynthesis